MTDAASSHELVSQGQINHSLLASSVLNQGLSINVKRNHYFAVSSGRGQRFLLQPALILLSPSCSSDNAFPEPLQPKHFRPRWLAARSIYPPPLLPLPLLC
jgi:hypothetical protein